MSNSAARARPGQDRVSLYEEITNKIITELEAGRLPWVQPWGSSGVSAPLAMPKCVSAWKKDPLGWVIGVQKGPLR
jgi:antirestriction protein ArdC